jgi:hypothetical protein
MHSSAEHISYSMMSLSTQHQEAKSGHLDPVQMFLIAKEKKDHTASRRTFLPSTPIENLRILFWVVQICRRGQRRINKGVLYVF